MYRPIYKRVNSLILNQKPKIVLEINIILNKYQHLFNSIIANLKTNRTYTQLI